MWAGGKGGRGGGRGGPARLGRCFSGAPGRSALATCTRLRPGEGGEAGGGQIKRRRAETRGQPAGGGEQRGGGSRPCPPLPWQSCYRERQSQRGRRAWTPEGRQDAPPMAAGGTTAASDMGDQCEGEGKGGGRGRGGSSATHGEGGDRRRDSFATHQVVLLPNQPTLEATGQPENEEPGEASDCGRCMLQGGPTSFQGQGWKGDRRTARGRGTGRGGFPRRWGWWERRSCDETSVRGAGVPFTQASLSFREWLL